MRLPGIEPGFPRWQREVLAIGQQTLFSVIWLKENLPQLSFMTVLTVVAAVVAVCEWGFA